MKSANLALSAGPAEDQPAPASARLELAPLNKPAVSRLRPRPRRPLAFRTVVIRDQGLRLFRCV